MWYDEFLGNVIKNPQEASAALQTLKPYIENKDITQLVLHLRDLFTKYMKVNSYADINSGLCDTFAMLLQDMMQGGEVYWDIDLDPDFDQGHCFYFYRDLYYDSECPEGVPDWKQLPYFLRNTNVSVSSS